MRNPVLLTVFAILLLFVGACENEDQILTEPAVLQPATAADLNLEGCWEPTPQAIIDNLEWETFDGTIQPGLGGFLMAQSTTWGPYCNFAIQVPPDALPAGVGPTDFSISFPTKASYMAYQLENCGQGLPLILDLEPHGLLFNSPVTVHATYMPWTDATITDLWQVWSAYPMFGESELEYVRKEGRKFPIKIGFKAPHFSRWEGGGGPPQEMVPIED